MARIALVLPDLELGGAERVAIALANGFTQQGHSVDFVLLQARGPLLASVPDRCRIVDLKAPRIRSAVKPLVRYFRDERPSSVQAFMWPVTIAAVIARAVSRASFPLTLSDHTTVSEHYGHFGRAKRAVLANSIRFFYPFADARIIVSQGAADDLRRLAGLKDVQVLRNPVLYPDSLPPADPEVIKLWNGRRRLLAVGNQTAAKDYPTLLAALALLPDDFGLVVVGAPLMQHALEKLAASLGISNRIKLVGSQGNVWPFYASAELFVLSSKLEGWPTVLIEALASGLPVVSTDCPSGPREILADGEFGTLIPVGDPAALAHAIHAKSLDRSDQQRHRGQELAGSDAIARYAKAMHLTSQP